MGRESRENQDPVIRVFYSSAILMGSIHFYRGKRCGWKLDGDHQILRESDYHKGRLFMGLPCYNREHGFGKPGATRLTFIANNSQETKSGILSSSYLRFQCHVRKQRSDDEILKCESIVTKLTPFKERI